MIEIILLAALSAYILHKLYKTLGSYDERERSSRADSSQTEDAENLFGQADIEIADAYEASLPQHVRNVLDKIREHDQDFTAINFLEGSKQAFEMIIKALNLGKLNQIKPLLGSDLQKAFAEEIKTRKLEGKIHTAEILEFRRVEIDNAKLKGSEATIEVSFQTVQISCILDREGNVIAGDMSATVMLEDVWVFTRNLNAKTNIWTLQSI